MLDLTFGEQVKIILSRKGMTIKELAEKIEKETGKKMSRQNLTQRLGRDNFQEQDMRMIAQILGCPFYLDILEEHEGHDETREEDLKIENLRHKKEAGQESGDDVTEEMTDFLQTGKVQEEKERLRTELDEKADSDFVQETLFDYVWNKEAGNTQTEGTTKAGDSASESTVSENETAQEEEPGSEKPLQEEKKKAHGWRAFFEKYIKHEAPEMEDAYEAEKEAAASEDDVPGNAEADIAFAEKKETEEAAATDGHEKNVPDGTAADPDDPDDGMFLAGEEDLSVGELNPYTGHEYESNSVRMNKKRIGYVQVYDRGKHQWMDMTEWAFLGYQERKKALLGKDYIPPIYLD